jgi:hypothetical protein
MPTPQPFPALELNYAEGDANPAIQLFGRRLFTDQTIPEYLVEFLLVCHSPKKIGATAPEFLSLLPPWDALQDWKHEKLDYMPVARLALKLFSFLGASKLETRHSSHMQQYSLLLDRLKEATTRAATSKRKMCFGLWKIFFLVFKVPDLTEHGVHRLFIQSRAAY